MSKLITDLYETKLESASGENICPILDAKLEATSPQGVADYIDFAVDNIDSAIERMKIAKKELDFRIKIAQKQIDVIKYGSALWLTEAGINKLNGDIVSSVSVYTPKPKESLKVLSEETLINQGYFKTVVDKTAAKKAILEGVKVDGAEIEVVHETSTLKINKRRVSVTNAT